MLTKDATGIHELAVRARQMDSVARLERCTEIAGAGSILLEGLVAFFATASGLV